MERETFCSFCGKNQNDVKKLIASPDSLCYICNNCIEICKEILKEQEQKINKQNFLLPTPKELKQKLDEYIIGQESAKKAMAVAVYNHYKRLNYNLSSQEKNVELDKSNILLIGPTGVGKTLIAKTLAKIIKVPFACVDATTLTEAGYVGDDVESILQKLLINADYDIKKAEMGIIYIDEIDKIAKRSENKNLTRDVSGEGVQQALLKILEGTKASVLPSGNKRHPHQDTVEIDTTNILFICGGAFVNLENIVKSRNNKTELGFISNKKAEVIDYKLTNNIRPDDLIEFGLIPEFVGRLPVVVSLDDLDETALVSILTTPKNSLISQYKTIFKLDGIDLDFDDDALHHIAQKALKLKIGARGLRTILEESMLDIMYNTPSEKKTCKITINKHLLQNNSSFNKSKEISAVSWFFLKFLLSYL